MRAFYAAISEGPFFLMDETIKKPRMINHLGFFLVLS